MAIKFNGLRWQQVVYLSVFVYTLCAIIASGVITRFNDIDFTGPYYEQYQHLTSDRTLHLETSVVTLIFVTVMGVCDLFRVNATPVWLEMSWSLVFGLLSVGNIVLSARDYPSAHCTLTPAINSTSVLSRRDTVTSISLDGVPEISAANEPTILTDAAKGVCSTWTTMFVFFTMVSIVTLLLTFGWWALVGLRHRASHPDFFYDPTPRPLQWNLPKSSDEWPAVRMDIETASVSSSSTACEEKKADLSSFPAVPSPTHTTVVIAELPSLEPRIRAAGLM